MVFRYACCWLWIITSFLATDSFANEAASKIKVITSFSILKDLVQNIGGEYVEVESLVGPDEDAHAYQPTPKDVKKLAHADIIFVNGLGFEGWIERLIEGNAEKVPIVTVTKDILPQYRKGSVTPDPHFWHNPLLVQKAIKTITQALQMQDPVHRDVYQKRFEHYLKTLDLLHQINLDAFDSLPTEKKIIFTNHDAFGYYGDVYAIRFIAPLGISTTAEPRLKTLIQMIKDIATHNIKTIFLENINGSKLMEQIAQEADVRIGRPLYSDALSSPQGPASTYVDMVQYNTNAMLQAIQETL